MFHLYTYIIFTFQLKGLRSISSLQPNTSNKLTKQAPPITLHSYISSIIFLFVKLYNSTSSLTSYLTKSKSKRTYIFVLVLIRYIQVPLGIWQPWGNYLVSFLIGDTLIVIILKIKW